jgi:hypothetical protein
LPGTSPNATPLHVAAGKSERISASRSSRCPFGAYLGHTPVTSLAQAPSPIAIPQTAGEGEGSGVDQAELEPGPPDVPGRRHASSQVLVFREHLVLLGAPESSPGEGLFSVKFSVLGTK